MNKEERFHSAIAGGRVDYLPATAWSHFQSDHLDSALVAQLHLRFMQAYDWDVMKVMNDYRYPVPAGLVSLESPDSLRHYRRLSMTETPFALQFEVLRTLRKTLGPGVPILETVFEPYQQIVRNIGFDQARNFFSQGRAVLPALEAVTQTTCDYVRAALAAGASGIFLSINGAIPADNPRGFTDEEHDLYQRPFTTAVLEAASGNVRALHVHGNHLVIPRIAGYPYEILSISDRLGGNPTLAELRKITDKCLMGGLDETRIQDMSLPSLDEQIDDAVAQAGPTGLILAPGCTIPSFTHQRNLAHIREYSRAVHTAA